MPTSHPNTLDFSNIALQPDPGDAFAALPVHVLITHVLSSRNLPDPSDLARLRAVSREMRDAVAATGRKVYELGAKKAIQFGDLSGLQLLHQRGDLCYDNITSSLGMCMCPWAAGEGQLEILKWLRANDFPWGKQTCERAALGGHIEVLQWAHANGCPWNENTCACAAYGGHLGVLQWMCTNGCPWDKWTCANAASEGHLELLQWARVNGCPWDAVTCSNAAFCGHLEVLQWARANGCPWDKQTILWARAGGHFELENWAIANGCPE
jgi:hypothetical protein